MGWFTNLFRREQTQAEQAQADQYRQLFSSFDRASMLNATPEQLSANRAQLHDLFASRTWNSLDYDTKCQAVQALENDFAYQQGRPAKAVEVTSLRDGCFGGWNAGRDTIRLNENLLKSGTLSSNPYAQPMPDANMQIFDTVAHEGYHAYQSYALEHPEVHADKAQLREWALNEGKYYGSGDKYLIQPQERDAWQYGYSATTQAIQGIEARNGPEPELTKAEYENTALANSYNAALAREQRRDPQVLQTMEQEMETACQQKGITYDFTGQSQTVANAPQPQAQGVQQGQAPPGPVTRTISAQSIDMSCAMGMDSPQFWNHHGNTKADYMALAEKLPAVQAGLAQGRTVDELKQDPELRDCVSAYYDPDNMVKVMQTPDGGYEFEDNGRHRIMAAREMGYDIPVQVVNAQAYAQTQADQLKEAPQGQNEVQTDSQEQTQAGNQEQAQVENQEQTQAEDQEQAQSEDQEQVQSQDQEQTQVEDQEQTQAEDQEQVQAEDQEQVQSEDQEQAQVEDQEQAQAEDQEQVQAEDQEQSQVEDQEQAQVEDQEQVQSQDQEQTQVEDQEQVQAEDQEQAQGEDQEQAQGEDVSMEPMAQQEPQEEQSQGEDLSMDQAAEQETQEEQSQEQGEDLSMEQAAQEETQEEPSQGEDLSMDQAAGQEQDSSAGEEQSSGQEEDQSQGYSY